MNKEIDDATTVKKNSIWCHLWSVFCGEKIPVWLSLILMVAGAATTYWLAPRINHSFEMQSVKRQFILSNLDSLNVNTQRLLKVVPKLLDGNDDKSRAEALEIITAMQFDSVRLNYTIPNRIDEILEYQKSLEKLNVNILRFPSDGYRSENVMNTLKSVSFQALQLYRGILAETGIAGAANQ